MEAGTHLRLAGARGAGTAVAGYLLPFALVFYLAMRGGGYDVVVRSEIGVIVWWLVLLGAAAGLLPVLRLGRGALLVAGLLAALAAWTGLSISWSETSERSVEELARVVSYLGVFALALLTQGREGARRTAGGVGAAIGLVAVLALLSRLHPGPFPENETVGVIEGVSSRLAYPLDYWNAVAALVAVGLPLLLWLATSARTVVARAISLATVPVLTLTAFYTFSRGGALAIAAGLVALVALHPRRLSLLGPAAIAAAGSAVVLLAAAGRDALENGPLETAASNAQGDEMLAITAAVCAVVALLSVGATLAARRGLAPDVRVPRRTASAIAAGAALVAIVIAVAAGVPGEISDGWERFRQPDTVSEDSSRLTSASGNGRWQYWSAAAAANSTEPLLGTGAGTFEFWWDREGDLPGTVRDAHSLYAETLGELGIVGLLLVLALVLAILAIGFGRALGAADESRRAVLAALVASAFAFAVAAGIDWAWEVAVLPVAFLLIAAALLAAGAEPARRPLGLAPRIAAVVASLAAIACIAIPLAAAGALDSSRENVAAGDLETALEDAETAASLQPYAATPRLQEALVLELQGRLPAALSSARAATEREETNWRTWLVLSRLYAEAGDAEAALEAYRRARGLNPRSPLLNVSP